MSKSEWIKSGTDKLVEKFLGWDKSINRIDGVYGWVNPNVAVMISYHLFKPATDMNHCMMLVESEVFRGMCNCFHESNYPSDNTYYAEILLSREFIKHKMGSLHERKRGRVCGRIKGHGSTKNEAILNCLEKLEV